jgi:hypothetical protein
MKHAIYGKLTFNNGLTINWLRFIPHSFTLADAKQEAIRIVLSQHKGMGITSISTV